MCELAAPTRGWRCAHGVAPTRGRSMALRPVMPLRPVGARSMAVRPVEALHQWWRSDVGVALRRCDEMALRPVVAVSQWRKHPWAPLHPWALRAHPWVLSPVGIIQASSIRERLRCAYCAPPVGAPTHERSRLWALLLRACFSRRRLLHSA